ncbi:MAG: DUF4040 domain-containing protein [Cyanobacteria bacterium J06632_3]
MTDDVYMGAITILLPLTAVLLVSQTNPYQALVIRGILGAIAALVYAVLGAADVALTEALVGTMLSITLYAIAVRSSMTLRVGIIEPYCKVSSPAACILPTETFLCVERAFKRHHVRVETLFYSCEDDLETALKNKEIHVAYDIDPTIEKTAEKSPDSLTVRNQQLYEILQPQIPKNVNLSLIAFENKSKSKEKSAPIPSVQTS